MMYEEIYKPKPALTQNGKATVGRQSLKSWAGSLRRATLSFVSKGHQNKGQVISETGVWNTGAGVSNM